MSSIMFAQFDRPAALEKSGSRNCLFRSVHECVLIAGREYDDFGPWRSFPFGTSASGTRDIYSTQRPFQHPHLVHHLPFVLLHAR